MVKLEIIVILQTNTEEGFFFYIYNLHIFKQKCYSHKVLVYLNVPEIPVKKPLQNRQIVEEQLDVSILLINKRIKTVNILI